MQNLFTVMLVLIGAALAIFVTLFVLHSSNPVPPPIESDISGTPAEPLIPKEMEGFVAGPIERVDPIFEGELFSVHASFTPAEDSPFRKNVESLGVTLFVLESVRAGREIKPLLLWGEAAPLEIEGIPMEIFINKDSKLVGMLWQNDLQIYYVLVSGVDSPDLDLDALNQAAQAVARAIVRGGAAK